MFWNNIIILDIIFFLFGLLQQPWCSQIWKWSIMLWRLLQNKLPTDDVLKRRGICIVSGCLLCDSLSSSEAANHLFVDFSFVRRLRSWLLDKFTISRPHIDSVGILLWINPLAHYYSIFGLLLRAFFFTPFGSVEIHKVQTDCMDHIRYFASFSREIEITLNSLGSTPLSLSWLD